MAGTETALTGVGYAGPTARTSMFRLVDHDRNDETVTVAEEVPLALVYNGRPYTVVMGTPLDLEDLAAGFSVTEGIVAHADALERIDVVRASHGIEVQIELSATDAARLADRSRALVTRTGCGLCGVETIHEAMRVPERVAQKLAVSRDALFLASHELGERQTINNETSTVHAAAWANASGEIQLVREDIGRHNALDKVLGALARSAAPTRDGFIVVTSRASYEMVQKAAAFGVELVAAVSRPTGLAVRFAELTGITLVGLLRGRTANVYSNSQRIT
ncbi:MAG TPA: formate dehydrogenase accessory sulfurtransferase FdhD [Gemmatimonadaceae bacterium]